MVNDSASDWWLTPLSWGADAGSAEAVELLLTHGADADQDMDRAQVWTIDDGSLSAGNR